MEKTLPTGAVSSCRHLRTVLLSMVGSCFLVPESCHLQPGRRSPVSQFEPHTRGSYAS